MKQVEDQNHRGAMMLEVTIKDLLEAGVHFGHQTRRWNPKMKRFIFTARNGIYIIDLKKTLLSLDRACRKVHEVIEKNQRILFVGTKKQAQGVIKEEAQRCGQFYVTERWLGGMMTNFQTIKASIKRFKELEQMKVDGTFEKLTKKEVARLEREMNQFEKALGGIKEMNMLPGLIFVVDTKKEHIAVAEAYKLGIPIIAIIDTNSDPDPIDFPVAGNDDAIKAIRIITKEISRAVMEAQSRRVEQVEVMAKTDADRAIDAGAADSPAAQ
jgi:small subunit ribosomal protein S2